MKNLILILFVLMLPLWLFAEPEPRMSVSQAIEEAPIIVLVERGKSEWDELKEGAVKETETIALDNEKREYKVLKIYKNKTDFKIQEQQIIEVKDKSNSCLSSPIQVTKQGEKLKVVRLDLKSDPPYFREIKKSGELLILFLSVEKGNENMDFLGHFGWFVSPQPYSKELEEKL